MPAILDGYCVLDLTDERGILCGRILADLGADVIRVEPPNGSQARRVGPWWPGRMGIEDSLVWQAWAANSRSITLDVASPEGRSLFVRLAGLADFLVESLGAGELERLGLDEETLLAANPRLVVVSISGFGAFGPHASYKAPDLVVMAMSGQMALTGPADGQPVRIGVPQAYVNACASAAAGALIAHTWRIASGRGQWVDVSAQQAVARSLAHAPAEWDLNRFLVRRQGAGRQVSSGVTIPTIWPCRDGYVCFMLFGSRGGRSVNALAAWVAEDGLHDELLHGTDWEGQDYQTVSAETIGHIQPAIQEFFNGHTKAELLAGAMAREIMLFPVNTMADVLEDPQLHGRGFLLPWPESAGLEARKVFPGPFVQASETPLQIRRAAPTLGEHNHEVYVGELGLAESALAGLRERGIV